MVTSSVKDKLIFQIGKEDDAQSFYGSNQDWYERKWQRMSGCGPSAVTNIIYYLNQTHLVEEPCTPLTKKECLALMNEIWNFVTPSIGGISSTSKLCEGASKYIEYKKLNIKMNSLDLPKKRQQRPDFKQIISFIIEALEKNTPVAFLNLDHGTVEELESWHWVTIISLEYDLEKNLAFVEILDGGFIKRIDLSKWIQTTKKGGGFVSFFLD